MAVAIKMPQLSDTMSSGKILVWSKKEGQPVARGEVLAEVETDKANLEIEAFQAGILLKIITPANTVAKVGEVIAYIGQVGESVPVTSTAAPAATAAAPVAPVVATGSPIAGVATTEQEISISSSSDRVKASPLAKRIALERNIDLSVVRGSGPNGRIVRRDLDQAASKVVPPKKVAPTEPASWRDETQNGGSLTALSKMRETIAQRMQEAVRETPHFYTTVSIDMSEALRLREALKVKPLYEGLSINHLVIKAAAYALKNEPRVNCSYRDGQLFNPGTINIGIITAVEDGLLIPVVRAVDQLSLSDLLLESRGVTQRAKAGKPSGQDLVGGTFSISNMGMFDVENFTAIINPGQGAVLAVSAVHEEPIVKNGTIVVGRKMKTTLSVDHRIIDGVMAANFLKYFKEALEIPALLMGPA